MTTTEKKRIGAQKMMLWVCWASSFWVFMLFGSVAVAYGDWVDTAEKSAAAGFRVVDLAAQKDIVWLALAAAIVSGLANVVQTALMAWISISGVKAIDRVGHKLDINPWTKGHK
jgi:hypothetical protein